MQWTSMENWSSLGILLLFLGECLNEVIGVFSFFFFFENRSVGVCSKGMYIYGGSLPWDSEIISDILNFLSRLSHYMTSFERKIEIICIMESLQ